MTNIQIRRTRRYAKMPTAATRLAGAYDVYAAEVEVYYDESAALWRSIVYTGLCMQPPPGYRIMIQLRSKASSGRWVMLNAPGLGDADYRGEYEIRLTCVSPDTSFGPKGPTPPAAQGERIAQMYLEKVIDLQFVEVSGIEDFVNKTDRDGGFGSTGTL